ncbi:MULTISPECIES: hypothetical protein [Sediminimonas]|uniref:hypothetical protein n=1 Tax=Sediminimonas TaxID=659427 RepID=UPI00047EC469|nr:MULTISPECIES: hypothetical protein [Sediminimonas]MDR9484667.1 hypothetical protein [Sediminimonas sp.]
MIRKTLSLFLLVICTPALSEAPVVEDVDVSHGDIGWRMAVTLSHPDTGWDHYADGWEVLDAAGNRLGYRKLHHPHVNEQPFTRSLTGIMVPDGVHQVLVKVRCSQDGWAGEAVAVSLER